LNKYTWELAESFYKRRLEIKEVFKRKKQIVNYNKKSNIWIYVDEGVNKNEYKKSNNVSEDNMYNSYISYIYLLCIM
jgi:hypothetical protein